MDLSRYTFYKGFVVTGTYTPKTGSVINDVDAVFSRGPNPGRESNKGITSNIRHVEANWTLINIKQSQVTAEPQPGDKLTVNSVTWEIASAEDTDAGAWRCEARRENTTRSRGRGRR